MCFTSFTRGREPINDFRCWVPDRRQDGWPGKIYFITAQVVCSYEHVFQYVVPHQLASPYCRRRLCSHLLLACLQLHTGIHAIAACSILCSSLAQGGL
jgi:hypothetical protein